MMIIDIHNSDDVGITLYVNHDLTIKQAEALVDEIQAQAKTRIMGKIANYRGREWLKSIIRSCNASK